MTESTTLLRGELVRETFRQYTRPVVARLRYERLSKPEFFFPDIVAVDVLVCEELHCLEVPYRVVDEETGTVAATLHGEKDGKILVKFPPTSFGQAGFMATHEDLARITKSSFFLNR